MQIYIKTLIGKNILLNVNPTDNIRNIKNKFQNMEGIAVNEIQLKYLDFILDDTLTLNDYNIKNNSIIHINLKLRI